MHRSLALVAALGAATFWFMSGHQPALSAATNTGVITGTVESAVGPEGGVWVIAETDDLETVFRKIVVTDDDGKFLLPDLPSAVYDVWVRGDGLADSDGTEHHQRAENSRSCHSSLL